MGGNQKIRFPVLLPPNIVTSNSEMPLYSLITHFTSCPHNDDDDDDK
jgi:hypothetical protein